MNTIPSGQQTIESRLWENLRQLIDPELGINVVDLGLIYAVRVVDGIAEITMTLTTSACPIGEALVAGVQHLAQKTPGLSDARVKVVWEPPWSPAMLSPDGREELGIHETKSE